MKATRPLPFPALAAIACAMLASCDRARPPPPAHPTTAPADTLAVVDGVPVGEADLVLKLKDDSRQTVMKPEFRKNLLDAIVREQAIAGRAIELGLDADPRFRDELRQREAQLNAFKRKELGDLFFRKEIAAKAAVSDAEARNYYDANAAQIRTEIRVWQILVRGDAPAEAARLALSEGKPFEEVAMKGFPDLPAGEQKPWDMGYLKWSQVPEQWRSVVDRMKPGDTSGIIRGPKDRHWIIKLIDRRENPTLTFDALKAYLIEVLRGQKIERRRQEIERELVGAAKVVYTPAAPAR